MVDRSQSKYEPSPSLATLVELLRWRADVQPEQAAYTFVTDDDAYDIITYRELDRRARAIGATLQDMGAAGEPILLLYPPGLAYIAAFFGCLYAGCIGVPAYPPRLNRPVPRIQAMVADSEARIAVTATSILENIEQRFEQAPDLAALRWVNTEELDSSHADTWYQPDIDGDTMAFLQYTSGSTSSPKGVILTHGNLMHNLIMIRHGFQMEMGEMGTFWLPSYHDMGLIGGILEPLYLGGTSHLMSPASFLQRPSRWLETITKQGGTITGAPNFAYDLVCEKISPEQRESLDLSSLKVAFSGAEPIRLETIERFIETFSPHGFNPEAFYPCYGLAEGTLLVAGGEGPSAPISLTIQKSALAQHAIIPAERNTEDSQTFVSSGRSLLQKIAIVDPDTGLQCPPDRVGEIWVSGPSVARGYWKQPEESARTFEATIADTGEGPFLRTGDLGFMQDGELYVTGRAKDLIIIRGRNHYPQDIEITVTKSHPALEIDAGAAFSVTLEDGNEHLVVVQEVSRQYARTVDVDEVAAAVRRAIAEHHEVQLYALVLIKPLKIPRTSSGKIRRFKCRDMFLNEELPVIGEWRAEIAKSGNGHKPALTLHDAPASRRAKSQSTIEIENWLKAAIASKAGLPISQIDSSQPFMDYGLDSVQAISMTGDLEIWLDRPLSPTLVWDYPNIESLAAYLAGDDAETQPDIMIQTDSTYQTEPIAIIGMGARFPGAESLDAFWDLLINGVDAISEVPADRWNADDYYDAETLAPGKMNTRWGGFLKRVDLFDPGLFGISPREASRMDPQQRILLEVAWEALEHAGQAPDGIADSLTGVFVGISSSDYSWLQFSDPDDIDAYAGTGNAHSIAANRLSYVLNLRGPSMAVDTACSSSLTALHLACQSLRTGEADMALAGGVNLLLTPELTLTFSQAQMMAADGRCKTFDASADGYVRGEGAGMVVLKRLSDAQRDGDNILAVVRGTAVNHDGRSNGITAPNGRAQQAVIRQALHNAGVSPDQISYIEAHGTGTKLGDPIEIDALRAVMDVERDDNDAVWVGSVKTNIGHLESAAGIAGLIKVVLSLMHETIPPHLHMTTLNPHISLDGSVLHIPTEPQTWRRGESDRIAGISSFGFGGTNAHAVLAEAPPIPERDAEDAPQTVERSQHILTLSARSERSLQMLAERYLTYAESADLPLADIAYSANTGRAQLDQRLAIIGSSTTELADHLRTYVDGDISPHLITGVAPHRAPRIAFLFTGQGAQYVGMGQGLYETQPEFKAALDRCDAILQPILGRSLIDILYNPDADPALIDETAYTQPALFAIEYALAQVWLAWGITPDVVIGHSIGEYVAACIAGVFSLEDGLALIAERGRLMQTLPQDGSMAAVFADADTVRPLLEPHTEHVSIAALNSPQNTVISGDAVAVELILARLDEAGIEARSLTVSHAFHSPHMDPILDEFETFATSMSFNAPQIPLVSNLYGRILDADEVPDAAYWRDHIREAVRFSESMVAIEDVDIFLETGPKPVLIGMGRQSLPASEAQWVPSLKRDTDDWQMLLRAVGTLYANSAPVDWQRFDQHYRRQRLTLPTYAFDRDRYWFEGGANTRRSGAPGYWQSLLENVEDRISTLPADATLDDIQSLVAEAYEAASHAAIIEPDTMEAAQPETTVSLRESLLALDPDQRLSATQTYLLEKTAHVLGLSPSRLDPGTALDTLGLDSLMAIEIKNRVETDLSIDLPIVALLEGPTIEGLSTQLVDLLDQPADASHIIALPEDGEPFDLSYGQQALWFLHQLVPDDTSFNVAGAVRLQGPLDVDALQSAFDQLVERHGSLRTVFEVVDGQPMQRVLPAIDTPFEAHDASDWSDAEIDAYLVDEANRPFDLERGPMMRVILLRRSDAEHILLIAMDHIITDFWSMSVLAFEIATLYEAGAFDREFTLPAPSYSFRDYTHWEQDLLDSPVAEEMWAYWAEQLSGELPILNLPSDHPRPARQSFKGNTESLTLSPELSDQLQALARSEGVTLFTVLLAAFQTLLHRYSGQDDLLVGSVMSGRDHAQFTDLVGYFINAVALRADFAGVLTFSDLLTQTRQTVLDAMAHQDYPPALIAQRLKIARDTSRPPLFETMFILQKAQVMGGEGLSAFALGIPGATLKLDSLTIESMDLSQQPAQFDLTLMVAELEDRLAATLHYDTALFEPETIQRMLRHLEMLLIHIAADPARPIDQLPMLVEDEVEQLLTGWNQTAVDYDAEQVVHELVEAQVEKTPDAIAVRFEGQSLTYDGLNRAANQLAHTLIEQGVTPGDVVGIYMERGIDMLTSMIAAHKAGAAYLPLDPAFPVDRLTFMIQDSGAKVLLTTSDLADTIDAGDVIPIVLDTARDSLAAMPDDNPGVSVCGDHFAYLIYTSGSTGKPKGVQVRHRNVINFLHSMRDEPSLTADDTLLAVTTMSFDISVLELFLPLIVGATVEIASRETASDGILLAELLEASDATIMQATPATWRMLIESGWQGDPTLRVLCGGEALTGDLADQLLPRCESLWNMYGPTETTVWSTIYPVTEGHAVMPIGRPIANTRVYLLDAQMNPVPVGVAGEIYIGGDGVTAGYINRPAENERRFVPDRFTGGDNFLYRTGDLARYLPNGDIEYLGRGDDQVKVRGYRIELGEIEVALSKHDAIQQAVVIASGPAENKRLVGYLVLNARAEEPSGADLRRFLAPTLPDYMIPGLYVTLDAFPMTANNKVRRGSLPAPEQTRPDLMAEYVEPSTPLEEELAQMCAELLGIDRVGVYDNFFDLGGSSLLATRLIFQVRERYQKPILLRSLFEDPTVAGLIHAMQQDPDDLFAAMTLDELNAEVVLDPSISGEGFDFDPNYTQQSIFLTGSTGFVGAFLLHDLLQLDGTHVYCLVRASDESAGLDKLRNNLENYGLWRDDLAGRITIIPGDLGQPALGINPAHRHLLATEVDTIYHCGALVNFVYPYHAHKAANVGGTEEILRLATTHHIKPVHFISTLSVFHTGSHDDGTVFMEDAVLDEVGVPFGGYAQSKWVSEKLVMLAQSRGIPTAIYRLGMVSGDSRSGAWNTSDMMSTLAKISFMVGAVPDLDVNVDVVPVDYCSQAVVHLAAQPDSIGRAFHLSNTRPLDYTELIEWVSTMVPLDVRPFEDWRAALYQQAAEMGGNGWNPFLPLIEEVDAEQVFMPRISFDNTLAGLEGTTITCPPVGPALLTTYLSYFNAVGFLEDIDNLPLASSAGTD